MDTSPGPRRGKDHHKHSDSTEEVPSLTQRLNKTHIRNQSTSSSEEQNPFISLVLDDRNSSFRIIGPAVARLRKIHRAAQTKGTAFMLVFSNLQSYVETPWKVCGSNKIQPQRYITKFNLRKPCGNFCFSFHPSTHYLRVDSSLFGTWIQQEKSGFQWVSQWEETQILIIFNKIAEPMSIFSRLWS